jgi:hypothetical protein
VWSTRIDVTTRRAGCLEFEPAETGPRPLSQSEIDHFVMAITAAEDMVRHIDPRELIARENSDAQNHSVCRCRRLSCDWFRSMGGRSLQRSRSLDEPGD